MTKLSSKARARAPGSLKETEERLSQTINDKFRADETNKYDISSYPDDIIPDKPIKSGSLIIKDYSNSKSYKVPFSTDESGEYVLGEKEEVQPTVSYEAVKSSALSVEKAKDHVLFTGTVLIPGEPDCDAENGEEILTAEKVARIAHSYLDYRIVDKDHEYLLTNQEIGKPVESWLLDEPKVMKNIKGEEREYPKGTWIAKSKITDPEMMKKAEKGELAYSVTALDEDIAEKLKSANKSRVLIKDLKDPVGFTLTLTPNPCVDNSCSVKNNPKAAIKAGQMFSKENLSVLQKTKDMIESLLQKALGDNLNSTKSEEIDMNEEELIKAVQKANEPLETKINDMGDRLDKLEGVEKQEPGGNPKPAIKCNECEHKLHKADKFCPKCGDEIKAEKTVPHETGGSSKSIPNHDDDNKKVAFKSVEHYMGRTAKGRPMKNRQIKGGE